MAPGKYIPGLLLMAALGLVSGCTKSSHGGSSSSASSNNARLADLRLSIGPLDQTFQPDEANYTASADFLCTSLRVTARTEDANASLTIDGVATASDSASDSIELTEGSNDITIEVTAEDGSTMLTYHVIVTRRDLQTFAQHAYIKASNTGAGDSFGFSVALSGDTLAVSAYLEDSYGSGVGSNFEFDNSELDSGAVYIFTRSNGMWTQEAYIKAFVSDASDRFGFSLALSGDTLAVGAYLEDSLGSGVNPTFEFDNSVPNSGAVYIYTRTAGVWSHQAFIKAFNTDAGDRFGLPVALSGDTLAVGAHREDSLGFGVNPPYEFDNSVTDSGAVYVFTRTGDVWSQQAYIKAPVSDANDWFGFSLAVSGDTLAVGAWREDSIGFGVDPPYEFDNSVPDSGAVFVFTRSNGTWSQEAYIKAFNTDADDRFGISVALSGDTLAVGANREDGLGSGVNPPYEFDNSVTDSGAVYVFARANGAWSQEAYVKPIFPGADDRFGRAVALSESTLAIGAHQEDSLGVGINNHEETDNSFEDAGAAYVYTRLAGEWTYQAYIKPLLTDVNDRFGRSVALSGDTLAVGAQWEDSLFIGVNSGGEPNNGAEDSGAVFIFW